MNYNKFADNIISKININNFGSLTEFSNYLNFMIDLCKLDINYMTYLFDIKDKHFTNPIEAKLSLLLYLIFHYIYNKNILKKRMGNIWLKHNTEAYSKRYTSWPTWELVVKYINGKESGKYKSFKSFRKELKNQYVNPNDFRKIVQMFGTYKSQMRRKLSKELN